VVIPQASTLLASKDPYNSMRAIRKPTPAPESNQESLVDGREVKPAEPVTTEPFGTPAGSQIVDGPVMKALPATEPPARTPITAGPVTPGLRSVPGSAIPTRAAPSEPPVKKAIPVQPQQQATPVEVRKAMPVGPLDEESEDSLLNKAATPPPADPDHE
jgi:hypothetical protein